MAKEHYKKIRDQLSGLVPTPVTPKEFLDCDDEVSE